jgi:hypothetical protein
MKITQLDLFSGIGGFHLGFEKAGYEVTSFFSEIDKHAIAVYKYQFPNSTYVGSVTNVREQTSRELTLSPLEVLAKILALLESVKGWEETEAALSLKQFASLGNADQEFLSGRMLKEHSAATMAKTLRQSSKRLPTLGAIDLNGNCLIHRGFYCRKTESGYTLSDILQPPSEIGEEYFLSEKTIERLMSYRDTTQEPIQSPHDTLETPTARSLVNINSLHKK